MWGMTTRPLLTQREAAAACGVSRTTIRRREAGDLPRAVQDPHCGWLISSTTCWLPGSG
jgi:predicted DNA-binding transcriptional regulator AlpA